jgi:ribonuclease VapC
MIVDSSAIVAILDQEDDWKKFYTALMDRRHTNTMSVATLLEVTILVSRSKDALHRQQLDQLIRDFGIAIVPVSLEQGEIARKAHHKYGRGSGHKAKLNFGDCFAYALAKHTGQPLLYKGSDFSQADIEPALA